MSLTGQTKNNSSTLAGTNKNSATLLGYVKSGQGWYYDQTDIIYDGSVDSEGRNITYDGVGSATTLIGLDKNNA